MANAVFVHALQTYLSNLCFSAKALQAGDCFVFCSWKLVQFVSNLSDHFHSKAPCFRIFRQIPLQQFRALCVRSREAFKKSMRLSGKNIVVERTLPIRNRQFRKLNPLLHPRFPVSSRVPGKILRAAEPGHSPFRILCNS
jgi:hypothetical protein